MKDKLIGFCISTLVLFCLTLMVIGISNGILAGNFFQPIKNIYEIISLITASAILVAILFIKEYVENFVKKN